MEVDTARLIEKITKAINGDGSMTRQAVYLTMREIAGRLRKDGQSIEQSFTKNFCDRGAPGAELYRLYAASRGQEYVKGYSDASSYPTATSGFKPTEGTPPVDAKHS